MAIEYTNDEWVLTGPNLATHQLEWKNKLDIKADKILLLSKPNSEEIDRPWASSGKPHSCEPVLKSEFEILATIEASIEDCSAGGNQQHDRL